MSRALANVVLLKLGWFACVGGAAAGDGWIGPLAVLGLLGAHFAWCVAPGERRREALMVATLGIAGCAMESSYTAAGLLVHRADLPHLGVLPLWIVALWFLFATVFDASLRWLRTRPQLAALVAAVGSPLSYLGGTRLGALQIDALAGSTLWTFGVLGIAWGLFVPTALRVAGSLRWSAAR
ncbi:MAG: DUF2878 domain-containing protein [Planctomycetes bacterium]|nr:DUF2878 domain-containing protein [Planctomycetota bacterium]